ncbi:hypothetical protein DXT96_16995 [Agrobacterium sp. ICMP 6402]|nr:hypothetical protein [Agrobacterium sp. ICMP 6402]
MAKSISLALWVDVEHDKVLGAQARSFISLSLAVLLKLPLTYPVLGTPEEIRRQQPLSVKMPLISCPNYSGSTRIEEYAAASGRIS